MSAITVDRIARFYHDLVQSVYVDWLTEYNTNTQAFGRGQLGGVFTILPQNTSSDIDDEDVEDELQRQVGGQSLPQPDANSVFMIHMPPGVSVSHNLFNSDVVGCGLDGSGYHNHFHPDNTIYELRYSVVADQTCQDPDPERQFIDVTATSSHELIEAVTNPDVASPLGNESWDWGYHGECEIADQCESAAIDFIAINHSRPELPNYNWVVSPQLSETQFLPGNTPFCIKQKAPSTLDMVFRSASTANVLFMNGVPTNTVNLPSVPSNFVFRTMGDLNGDGWGHHEVEHEEVPGQVQQHSARSCCSGAQGRMKTERHTPRTAGPKNSTPFCVRRLSRLPCMPELAPSVA